MLEYLSWSRQSAVEWSEKSYYERYILGKEVNTPAIRLGKHLAEVLEGKEKGNPIEEHIKLYISNLPETEKELRSVIKGIPVRGFADKYMKDDTKGVTIAIDEIKTGKEWTQSKADTHGQLTFYSAIIYQEYKVLPKLSLKWCPTIETENGLELTGEIITFNTQRTLKDILLFHNRMENAWKKIKAIHKKYGK